MYIFSILAHTVSERMVCKMSNKNTNPIENTYDDDNIPEIDLPHPSQIAEPLPESTRPRKDGSGGDGND